MAIRIKYTCYSFSQSILLGRPWSRGPDDHCDKAANKPIGNELLQDYAYLGTASQPTLNSTQQSPKWGMTQIASQLGSRIPMRAPDGSSIYVPAEEVQSALDAGATY